MEFMICFTCKGDVEKSKTTYMTEYNGCFLNYKKCTLFKMYTMWGRIFKWGDTPKNRGDFGKIKEYVN